MEEIWKDIENQEGRYQVSNLGNVRSLDRLVLAVTKTARTHYRRACGKVLKPHVDKLGYAVVNLYDYGNRLHKVHRLVASAFIPKVTKKPKVNHKDLNKLNNRADNLEWCTQKENVHHFLANGVKPSRQGVKNGRAKLSPDDVIMIRFIGRSVPTLQLAKSFNMDWTTINNILNYKLWAHL